MLSTGLRIACACAASALALTACSSSSSSGGGSGGKTLKVAYVKFGNEIQVDAHMQKVKAQFEAAHPGVTVKLDPIAAAENDYYTKIDLMMGSGSTAPDVVYEDTFLINSDIKAGYLAPLDSYLASWSDWSQFPDTAKSAARGIDGKTYGVPMGTDTRALYYNKAMLTKAGVAMPWQPKSWQDVLAAAKAVKATSPGVTPLNVYAGKPDGEGSTMQGFEMLLYGTKDTLYDSASKKWTAPSKGFTDSLQFLKDAYSGGLTLPPQTELDPNIPNVVSGQMLPQGKLAIDLDGSWVTGTWGTSGAKPWPQWNTVIGEAAMPTQDGSGKGTISMSGGWTLSVTAKSKNKDLGAQFVELALNKENSASYDIADSQIAVRNDVAADPSYQSTNPTTAFFTGLVPVTQYRPAYAEYPKISDAIQVAMEAVITGQSSPADAMKAYTATLKGIVGSDNVAAGAS
ncbi:extracellular solute-binding protein family 1 [Catenulispora acidiphila DSM 44928]|uniref:Extracellular solute-binding protein family 1 n=1 Tax=Catenulispora acidiphila (strain DSM 44928 / JCM 14897 / NBRC 102108 / NRRL B-24433 / ID139908) TaxID=479433 RepID=C7QFV7_CATAD|nr:extracellular solute-binding protein [Catenulispora acidiphila]ACU70934.1 extracellular solute-binding protein family 1 [Catenulispora acidiphila DSM 44928]